MSRLIDADELLQEFETENVAHNSDIWHITGIKAFIENQPTAFDKEKVIEALEVLKEKGYAELMMCEVNELMDKSIDIVKKGGVE